MLDKIWTTIKHNHCLIVAVVICIVMVMWGIGCEPSVKSPFDPTKRVTRTQLDIEVQNIANLVAGAYAEIKRQEQVRDVILNAGLAYAQGTGINPVGLALTLAGILGVGAVVDNRRKDSVIMTKDNALKTLKPSIKDTS